jgi:SAM-dependent MidA family methyltransferase
LSAGLRERQQAVLAKLGDRVRWLDELPASIDGLIIGNEVLDAMPVQLLHFDGTRWHERGVAVAADGFEWADRVTGLRPPFEQQWIAGSTVEIHPQARAFIATLVERMRRAMAIFIDYGFPEAEYYHPQRHQGTLLCHRAHLVDADPLVDVGAKDITAHVDFTGIALAAQEAGFEVAGYTSQAHLLINCGLLDLAAGADPRTLAAVNKLLAEHEMGELFKALLLVRGAAFEPIGFAAGDRTHRL